MDGTSPKSNLGLGEAFSSAFPEHLCAWLEESGDLWQRPRTIAPGESSRAIAEEMLDRHVEEFGDLLDELDPGSPARSAGAPCQSSEQVGNRTPDAWPEADQDHLHPGLPGDLRPHPGHPGPDTSFGDWGPAFLGGLSRRERAGRARRRVQAFGGPTYNPVSPTHCQTNGWTLQGTSTSTGEWTLWRFRCRSWRCRRCAPRVNARDAERIEEALGPVPLDQVLFLTLTFDPARYGSPGAAWRETRECWKKLRDELAYRYGEGQGRGKRKARLVYVQTWEQTRNGWPHVHALVWSSALAADMKSRGSYQLIVRGEPRPVWRWGSQVLRGAAVRAGFGEVVDVQFPRRERGQLAAYLVKIASELTGSAKKDQTPVAAPKGFRRIRATPKFLEPARRSSGEYVGALLAAPLELVLDELEAGAGTFLEAAARAKGRADQWLRRPSARTAGKCSIPGASPPTELVATGATSGT